MFNFDEIYVSLSINIILLFSVSSVYILLPLFKKERSIYINVLIGIAFGFVGLLIMSSQFEITDGFLLDTRSVLVNLIAAFFGFVPFVVSFIITGYYRFTQGGAGALTGILVIFNTGLVGYFYGKYRLKRFKKLSSLLLLDFYLLGLVTHIVMLLTFFTLPFDIAIAVLGQITIPVLLLYPVATVLIATVLFKQRMNIDLAISVDDISKQDYLTGTYNRFFYEQLIRELDKSDYMPLSIIMGDINGLKTINDSFGHAMGDKLIIAVSNVLKDNCSDTDYLARWGGDEFVIVLPNTSEVEATKRIVSITQQLNKVMLKHSIVPSISLGIGAKTELNQDFDKVLREAEDMMYRNKLSSGLSTRSNVISLLENTLLEKSLETTTHTKNMENYSIKIANVLELTMSQKDELKLISRLHDIGKVGISDKILLKNGKLTADEYEQIKKHPEIGYRILSSIDELEHIANGVLFHHEKWDGTGYPHGLKEDEIPLLSRIVSVADAYEVMTNGRIYKAPLSKEQAIEEIKRCSGTQFDPSIAELFINQVVE